MHVAFEVPEDIARALTANQRPLSRAAVEALAAEAIAADVCPNRN